MKRRARLTDLVDLAVQLQRDADEPQASLHQRDRMLVTELRQLPVEPRKRVSLWLERMRAAGHELPGRRVSAGYRLLLSVLALAGLLAGGAVASVVFHYDGTRPVNVVHVLAVFVGAQVALLVLVGVVMLPAAWLRRIPGAQALQESLALLSPGQAIRVLRRRLPERWRDALTGHGMKVSALPRAFEPVWKWVALLAAQVFALAFNLGALAAGLYLVTFSDLAFAWSTTLQPDVARVQRLTQALATPWARWVPAAAPSAELIRSTLYYRHELMTAGGHPAGWGGWWPFLVAAMGTYGVLPRLLLLAWAVRQLQRQLNLALAASPGAALVLERLGAAWVSTQATTDETGPLPATSVCDTGGTNSLPGSGPLQLINWSGLAIEDTALQTQGARVWRRPVADVRHAGGRSPLAVDEETIAALSRAGAETVIVALVKGWEPPLLEFLDFVQAVRKACGRSRWIVVVPVILRSGGTLQRCAATSLHVWQRKLRALGDPTLDIRDWPGTEEPAP